MTGKQETKQRAILTVAHHDYEKGLNAHAFFKMHNRSMSEGLVQDTFMKTWAFLLKGGKVNIMKAFLYHILNRLIIDEYRKKKTGSLDALVEKGFQPSNDESEHRDDILDGKSAALLIESLPKTYRQVMRMRYVEEFSLQKIASLTGQSKNAITVQTHRGLGKLQSLYRQAEAATELMPGILRRS